MKNTFFIASFLISFLVHWQLAAQTKPEFSCRYLTYLPADYHASDSLPLLIYLHGGFMRGNDLSKIKSYGLPKLLESGKQVDFLVICPQCPDTTYWSRINWFDSLYQEVKSKYKIDPYRVYVTGISMGGFGAWHAALDHPDQIAGILPLCGGCNMPEEIEKIKSIPVWAFHGTADKLIKFENSADLVERLKACEGKVKFTPLEGKGHNIGFVYEREDIYEWLLEQRK